MVDYEGGDPLVGVNIVSEKNATATDQDGYYRFNTTNDTTLTFSYIGYKSKKINLNQLNLDSLFQLNIKLKKEAIELGIVVVSASAIEKRIEEETVSIDIIKPYLIKNNNITNMSDAIEKVPGVKIIDEQVSIRNGAGWAFSLGSRVQVLVDGQSYLSSGTQGVAWGFIPTEVKQVEIIKGSASVLYGNASLNGIINILTDWPTSKPKTSISVYSGLSDAPYGENALWWRNKLVIPSNFLSIWNNDSSDFPFKKGVSFQHARRIGQNFDFILGLRYNRENNYIKFVDKDRIGLNFKARYRDPNIVGLTYGLKANIMREVNDRFIIFDNDTSGIYVPYIDDEDDPPLLFEFVTNNISIVPSISYNTRSGALHKFSSSFFSIIYIEDDVTFPLNTLRGSYQFQKSFINNNMFTFGSDLSYGWILNADLFNQLEPYTLTKSFYSQYEHEFGDLRISVGGRIENYEIQNIPINDIDSAIYFPTTATPSDGMNFVLDTIRYDLEESFNASSGLIKRIGINYNINSGLFLRASYGEGYRIPSLLERYMKTANYDGDDFFATQNPTLKPESGSSSEIGMKQILPFPSGMGYVDLALFSMDYVDYIELVFRDAYIYEKDSPESGPQMNQDGMKTIFRTENIGDVKISGFELTTMAETKLFNIPLRFMGGYTFTYPGDLKNIKNSGCKESVEFVDPLLGLSDWRICTEGQLNSNNYWDLFINSFDGIDDEHWKDQNNNDYFDEGDWFKDENGNGQFDNEAIGLLPYRHRHSSRFDIETSFKEITTGLSLEFNSGIERVSWYMANIVANVVGNGMRNFVYGNPYTLVNFRIGYNILDEYKFTFLINNLTNIEYAHRIGYMGSPRSFELQFSTQF